ncbi:MAG: RNA-guided pseudouridylation complex pseudouridine synthase subunit Cbf5 [Candidatus Thermoplasmatota archaeon]|nr:RNA-guided pseudouridylation complex pseudouridine synthase subunit Cbf5 [Candidatus Thermoplasmatota archaeon]MBU1941544.1 RNA-guided pseudouridylation complex pseudouridine synthase subunit Cbf5 [Candidatus Thermoplasmatota archaeon]
MSKNQQKNQLPCLQPRKRLIKINAATNPHYGRPPQDLGVSNLVQQGCVILDKPCGPTSHQVVAWVKNILNLEKAGHGGTLDPAVSGVLPIAFGSSTNALQVLLTAGKEYISLMKLHKTIPEEKITKTLNKFVGDINQIPPVRSAVKRVRRKRQIYYIDILEIMDRDVLFRVGCEAGTYIRTLCVDIGKTLHTGAHLEELRRTRVGCLTEENTFTLQTLKDAYTFWKEDDNPSQLLTCLNPVEYLFSHLPAIIIRDSAVDALCHGAHLAVPGIVELDTGIKKGDAATVFTLKNEVVALVHAEMSTEEMIQRDTGVCATLSRVLMKKGTYPSVWKKT